MESRTSNKYIKIHWEWRFPVKNRLSRKMITLTRRCPLTDPPPPPPCSPTSPTYAIRELEKEEVWTYLTNGAMSQFVSALVAGSITAPSLVITATSYWNIKHKQTLNLNWADICHCVVPDIHTTLLPPYGELCFLLFLKKLVSKGLVLKDEFVSKLPVSNLIGYHSASKINF